MNSGDVNILCHSVSGGDIRACMRAALDWLILTDIPDTRIWDITSHTTEDGGWEICIYYYTD